MPNQFDFDGRGPSTAALVASGLSFVLVCVLVGWLLLEKSQGKLDPRVEVTAVLTSVGDGLPPKSDVKFRGVLVGAVRDVIPAAGDAPNVVHLDLKPARAQGIPKTVTARIVPSNAFAVSSVQLVDNGPAPVLRSGDVIAEDQTLPTQLFQNTLARLRELVTATARPDNGHTLGLFRLLADATAGQGPALNSAAQGLNRIVAEMNELSAEDDAPATLHTWESAVAALRDTAPELLDSLHHAVIPMRTIAEKQAALHDLLTGAQHTVGTMRTAMDHHTDELVAIGTQMTPVVGVLADSAGKFPAIAVGINNVVNNFFDELWTRTGSSSASASSWWSHWLRCGFIPAATARCTGSCAGPAARPLPRRPRWSTRTASRIPAATLPRRASPFPRPPTPQTRCCSLLPGLPPLSRHSSRAVHRDGPPQAAGVAGRLSRRVLLAHLDHPGHPAP
ncbi:hypothetical protein A5735_20480 [Mycolicibacter heraklionensis]|nr:hypothetical protein A5735_20480 [Mycolicibacter heraklionensis]